MVVKNNQVTRAINPDTGKSWIRFGIVPTYRCNAACKWCNRFLDVLPWPDSDLSVEDLEIAGKIVSESDFDVLKIRLTGGEPLLHPDFVRMAEVIKNIWKPFRPLVSFTNGILPKPEVDFRFSCTPFDQKKIDHRPWMISPADLGLKSVNGFGNECGTQYGCGRLFDAFGFSFCVHAGSLGRILRKDVYSGKPRLIGEYDICKHCVYSLRRNEMFRLQIDAANGKVEFPTKTYLDGIEKFRKKPFVFRKFRERI